MTDPAGQTSPGSIRLPLAMCLATSAAVLALAAVELPMADFPSPLALAAGPVLVIAFCGCGLWSLVLLTRLKRWGLRAALPGLVCAATLAALAGLPFTKIWLQVNFLLQRQARAQIVAQVAAGDLVPNVPYNARLIALPAAQRGASAGGEIVVEPTEAGSYVLFLTSRGLRHRFSGFLHVPAGGDPARFFEFGDAPPRQSVRYGEGWIFVSN